MFWMDYTIEQSLSGFRVKGDTETEVMDKGLYKPGDVYMVNEKGWLVKRDELSLLMMKYEEGKINDNRTSNRD